jgi:hypothetical protein
VITAPTGPTLTDGQLVTLTLPSGTQVNLEYDSGYMLQVARTSRLTVPPAGTAAGLIADGQTFTITNGGFSQTFEFDSDNSLVTGTNRRVVITSTSTATQVRDAIMTALSFPASSG